MAPSNQELTLFRTIGLTAKFLTIYLDECLLNEGIPLTRTQFVLLKILTEKDGFCQNEIASITNRDKTSLTRLVDTLVHKKFVQRKPSQVDKRKNKIFITQLGRKAYLSAWPVLNKIEDNIKKELTETELLSMLSGLEKIKMNVIKERGVIS